MAAEKGQIIAAKSTGKLKTIAQLAALITLALHYPIWFFNPRWIGVPALYAALVLAIYSGVEYVIHYYRS